MSHDEPSPMTSEQEHARELEWILLGCRRRLAEAEKVRFLGLCGGALDWDYVGQMLKRQSLAAIVHHQIKEIGADPPAALAEGLREAWWACSSRNFYNAMELIKLLGVLQAAGVAAIPLKGPAVWSVVYGDLRVRPSNDLDILIRPGDFARAREVLAGQGFRDEEPLDGAEDEGFFRDHNEAAFYRDGDGVMVELHWAIMPESIPFAPPSEVLWESAAETEFMNGRVLQFAAEVTFLMLCVHHGVQHQWGGLLWILDIARFVECYPALDWERVFALAEEYRCRRVILTGCLLARELFRAPLAAAVAARAERDRAARAMAAEFGANALRLERTKMGRRERLVYYLRLQVCWRDRVRLVRKLLLTPKGSDRAAVGALGVESGMGDRLGRGRLSRVMGPLARLIRLLRESLRGKR